ncbi:sigma-70 family RNA polymerase sigma factor [Paraburkholderia rhizosphaerae]|uniref:RNA polymerase sigma-70 factor (ECF subfamily) n=1 Tax=Paraburkholderia rhizosphaerae TaxID=480658 RepID=A0A4R8M139_9BURK|nr:sigma-70 family RNA polymerase sigma factor [Paraburkholderia rhizosphaerae]TDY53201.1 RNA polymerase sigma-70 factor (ECF subfamily) [Paraburkholderia rhizosphaerae]
MDEEAEPTEAADMDGTMDGTSDSRGTNNASPNGVSDASANSSPPDAAFEKLRRKLVAHAQRMLGSRVEAEDVVQDAWLKWHSARNTDVRSPHAWLTTVTTRLAIDRLRRLRTERVSQLSGDLALPWLDGCAPAADEAALHASDMSYGVTLLLDRLKPDERVAFVLHEALDCDYAEIAKILAKTPAHCRQIVHRAKERLRRAGAPLKTADPAGHARIVERLRAAIDAQDRVGLVRLFSDGVHIADDQPCVNCPSTSATSDPVVSPQAAAARVARISDETAVRTMLPRRAATAIGALRAEAISVSVDGTPCIAWLADGEIAALLEVVLSANGAIAALRIVTDPVALGRVNQTFGLSAVRRLLRRIGARASGAWCGAVPVDIDA